MSRSSNVGQYGPRSRLFTHHMYIEAQQINKSTDQTNQQIMIRVAFHTILYSYGLVCIYFGEWRLVCSSFSSINSELCQSHVHLQPIVAILGVKK